MKLISCACGCSRKRLPYDLKRPSRIRRFIKGHARKNKLSGKFIPCFICKKIVYRRPKYIKKNKWVVCSYKCQYKLPRSWNIPKGPVKYGTKMSYLAIKERGNPMANKDGYMLAHRITAAKIVGRPLKPNEFVHHVNGIKTDNRPENLRVLSPSEHAKLHHPKKHF